MTINSRNKGASGERELANLLKSYGYKTWRGQQYSGANGDADVEGLMDIWIEVKRVEKLNIDKAMEQADRDSKTVGIIPAVFHRKNRKPWKVTMYLEDWMKLYQGFEKSKEMK